jgi:hypothetical protein
MLLKVRFVADSIPSALTKLGNKCFDHENVIQPMTVVENKRDCSQALNWAGLLRF